MGNKTLALKIEESLLANKSWLNNLKIDKGQI